MNEALIADLEKINLEEEWEIIDLDRDGGKVEIPQTPEQQFVLAGTPTDQKYYKVFDKSIFGNNINMGVNWDFYETYSVVYSKINLNSKPIYNVFNTTIQHPWAACKNNRIDINKNQEWQLFSATIPVLGILNIKLRASVMLAWGYLHEIKQNGSICDIHFKPYAKPGI